ncbi:MAG: oxygen-independent coproporphyrinogen III oxidase [Proteobacteria bacterium]|nr:oxygen-independent coproporphyrinogen III oxidase [Pseudomonadota bacterium]
MVHVQDDVQDKMDILQKLIKRYGGPAPRYTSYPSAAQFKSGLLPSFQEQFLKNLPPNLSASLYLHIPFCRSLCHYCGCFTRVIHNDNPLRDYLNLLEKEIAQLSSKIPYRFPVKHIHFGGGSPNLLTAEDIKRLLNVINVTFQLQQDAEIAIEADPRQMTAIKARDYAEVGINRVSLGVQDFQDKTQKVINRLQPFSNIVDCTAWLRKAGVKDINFDLMYGLPYQTVETVLDNVFKALSLEPDRIALFGYAHVSWLKPHQKNLEKYELPNDIQRYEQAEAARKAFNSKGYISIGMDHFAKPDDLMALTMKERKLRRNFQGYTTDCSALLFGFGLSAISHLPQAYVQNTSSFKLYKKRIEQHCLPVEKGFELSKEDKLRADIIEKLMCYFTVDIKEVCQEFSLNFLEESLQKLKHLKKDGLVDINGTVITITEQGKPFVRSVCTCFDAYFQEVEKRYARAV